MKKLLVCSLMVFASAWLFQQALIASAQPAINTASAQVPEKLSADAPKTTVLGNAFIAPKDWSIRVKGPATILEAPEGDSWVALIDVEAKTQDEALAAAWQAYKPDAKWPLKVSNDLPDRDGWSRRRAYEYQTSPNEKRTWGDFTTTVLDIFSEAKSNRGSILSAIIFSRTA